MNMLECYSSRKGNKNCYFSLNKKFHTPVTEFKKVSYPRHFLIKVKEWEKTHSNPP